MEVNDAYQLVSSMASPSTDEGLKKERAVLLLWFLRNVVGLDDLDAYENVCDGDKDQGIDGAYLEERGVDEEKDTFVLLQSKYPLQPSVVGPNEIAEFIGKTAPFESLGGLRDLLSQGKLEPELKSLIERLAIEARLEANSLRLRVVFVTAGVLKDEAHSLLEATNAARGYRFITAYDLRRLGPIIEAVNAPTTVQATVGVDCTSSERFVAKTGNGRIAVCAVKAEDIVGWPGIDDRSLFDLNVRHELRPNRVRRELDSAIRKQADHPNFLAFHNGMTVVCEEFDDSQPDTLIVRNMSVVNGTQSAIALKMNEEQITLELRLLVKFVELGTEEQVAREVARRSNTQNPVNARNLRALDGRQLTLRKEFEEHYPAITYETRPDYRNPPTPPVIQNDIAAQLLTAVYNQKAWLAVKRLSLFEDDQYRAIFHEGIAAHHIVFADRIRQRVQASKAAFPDEYQRSWQLTALVATYLVGQLMRADADLVAWLDNPVAALSDSELDAKLDLLVKNAAGTLTVRHDGFQQKEEFDDFKVAFKRESALKELANSAREKYLYFKTLDQS
jgi:hypothetical protein